MQLCGILPTHDRCSRRIAAVTLCGILEKRPKPVEQFVQCPIVVGHAMVRVYEPFAYDLFDLRERWTPHNNTVAVSPVAFR